MVTMQFLRLLADLSFYATFAAYIAAHRGGTGAWGGVLLCCGCHALASRFHKRAVRLACLVPLLCCGLYRGADLVFLLPCVAYTLYLTWQGDYLPDRDRQRLLFSVFWKVLAFCLPFVLLSGHAAARAAALPFAVLMLAVSVLLLRALRHEPAVWCGKGYQLMELSLLAATLLTARILGSATLLRALGASLRWVYRQFVLPVLVLLLRLLVWGLGLVFRLLALLPGRENAMAQKVELDLSGISVFEDMEPGSGAPDWLAVLGRLLLLAAVTVLLVGFFRWLSRRRSRGMATAVDHTVREAIPNKAAPRQRESGSIKGIRRQYRRFLKLCEGLGAERTGSSTSLDVEKAAAAFPELRELAGPIRALYVPARYGHRGDKAAEDEMKRLCAEARRRSAR